MVSDTSLVRRAGLVALVLAALGLAAYALVLQAIEVVVALALGVPALAGESTSLRNLRRMAEGA